MSSDFEREAEHIESLDDLHRLLVEGLESGEAIEADDEFWEQLEREVLEKCQQKLDDSE